MYYICLKKYNYTIKQYIAINMKDIKKQSQQYKKPVIHSRLSGPLVFSAFKILSTDTELKNNLKVSLFSNKLHQFHKLLINLCIPAMILYFCSNILTKRKSSE